MMDFPTGISIVICCYNSAKRLPATLGHLAAQKYIHSDHIELIIIDNCCTDHTVDIAQMEWKKLGNPFPLIIRKEDTPGLSSARKTGFEAARYSLILMCDDDNWLAPDYLYNILEINNKNPTFAALGGWGTPQPETTAPNWFEEVAFYYATGKTIESGRALRMPHEYIYGAGMCIRNKYIKQLFEQGFRFTLTDRKGQENLFGGDVELMLFLSLFNQPILFDERLKFRHFIPKERLDWDYVKVRAESGYANLISEAFIHELEGLPNTDEWYNNRVFKRYLKLPLVHLNSIIKNTAFHKLLLLRFKHKTLAMSKYKKEYFEARKKIRDMKNRIANTKDVF